MNDDLVIEVEDETMAAEPIVEPLGLTAAEFANRATEKCLRNELVPYTAEKSP